MEVSSRDIEDRSFATALRGYDRDEVDRFMAECAQHTGNLEERTKIAEVRAATAETELAEMTASIDVLLEEATDARRKIIEEARADASAIASQIPATQGQGAAEDVTASAVDDESAEILRQAEASANTIRADADRILAEARRKSESILDDARASKASMETQLAEIREILNAARADDAETLDRQTSQDVDEELVIDLREVADEPRSQQVPG